MQPQPKDRREIESIVQNAISDAVDFVESEISQDRIKAQRYYDGEVDIGHDTLRKAKPDAYIHVHREAG